MVDREHDVFRVTAESRPEHLSDWDDTELLTLHERLTTETQDGLQTLRTIEEILAERQGVDIHERIETMGEHPDVELLQARLGNPEE